MMRKPLGRIRHTVAILAVVSVAGIGLSHSTYPVSADNVASAQAIPVAAAAGESFTWSEFGASAGKGAAGGAAGGLVGAIKGAVVGAVVGAVAGAVSYIVGWLFGNSAVQASSYPATALD
jgi:hypothetical protein